MPFPLFLALKYLRPRRDFVSVIPIITTVGVCLGVAILMIVLAVMTGYGDAWKDQILGFKPHISVYDRYGDFIADTDSAVEKIEKTDGVKSVCPAIITPVMLGETRNPVQTTLIGIDPERESILSQLKDKIHAGEFDITQNNVLIGVSLARQLGAMVGSEILCYSPQNLNAAHEVYLPEEMIVAGIFHTGKYEYDSSFVICSLGMAREVVGADSGARLIQAQLHDPEKPWLEARALAETLGPFYRINTWQEEDETLFQVLRTEKTMMFILLMFIAIVAAFCVTNTLILITLQKTREIGLLKALGFSNRRIEAAFVLNGLIQCVVGEALGVGLGWVVLRNIRGMINSLAKLNIKVFPPEIYGLDVFPWRVIPSDVISVTATVFVFCVLAAYLPAWRAARLDPVKAIND